MPFQEVLILAMTKMKSGICTAGFTTERAPVTGLRWVRPTREFDTVLPEDMMDADGRLIHCGDVVSLKLIAPRPDPPHIEDWVTDFVRHRPQRLRRLEGAKRAAFFQNYLDQAPAEVFIDHTRSLCLVQPEQVWASFFLDKYSGKYQARLRFTLFDEPQCPRAHQSRGLPVTDLKWRALGRQWLATHPASVLCLEHDALLKRLSATALYLTLGISRQWQGEYWPLVHAVHIVPDYEAHINLENL